MAGWGGEEAGDDERGMVRGEDRFTPASISIPAPTFCFLSFRVLSSLNSFLPALNLLQDFPFDTLNSINHELSSQLSTNSMSSLEPFHFTA